MTSNHFNKLNKTLFSVYILGDTTYLTTYRIYTLDIVSFFLYTSIEYSMYRNHLKRGTTPLLEKQRTVVTRIQIGALFWRGQDGARRENGRGRVRQGERTNR